MTYTLNIPTKKKTRRPPCPCCKHALPHCVCRRTLPPKKVQPVTTRPAPCQLSPEWQNLDEIAWGFRRKYHQDITVLAVSGAIEKLGLKHDTRMYNAPHVRGCRIGRQQTMILALRVRELHDYIARRLGLRSARGRP